MYLNGVVLVSPTELGIKRDGPVGLKLKLPTLPPLHGIDLQNKRRWTAGAAQSKHRIAINELIPRHGKGGFPEEDKKKQIAAKMAHHAGT